MEAIPIVTFDLDTFQTSLQATIEVALAGTCEPGDVAIVLREEASNLAADGYVTAAATDEYIYELPSEDPTVTSDDVLAQVIAGSFSAGRIRLYDLELHSPGTERWGPVWAVYDLERDAFVTWLNVATFRTPADLAADLVDLSEEDDEGVGK